MLTPDLGCRTNSTKIRTTTIQGNSKTTPSGIEILELPLNRKGLRKKAHLDETFVFPLESSSVGSFGAVGNRFITLWTKPIGVIASAAGWGGLV
jgi:hypothetical protein